MFTIKKQSCVRVLLVSLVLLSLVSCASSPYQQRNAPIWLHNPSEALSDKDYITAVGYAPDRATAESIAISNITKSLKQKVEAETTASQIFDSTNSGEERKIETTIKTSSLIDEISGIRIYDTWTAREGTVFAIASLSRNEVGTHYYKKINDNEDAIIDYLAFMADNEASFEGIKAGEKALALAYENEAYLDMLSVINPMLYRTVNLLYKSASAVEVVLENEREKIYISIYVEGDDLGRITFALSSVLEKAGHRTEQLLSLPENSVPYLLYAELSIAPLDLNSTQNNKYVRFTLNTQIKNAQDKLLLPWNCVGREAHLSTEEAAQRSIRTLEEKIAKEYLQEVLKLNIQ